jgi:lysophospholipase L1-like esterase
MRVRLVASMAGLSAAALLVPACGGSGPGTGPTPQTPTHTVTVTVFYDENGDGQMQPGEVGRVPGVEVEVGGRMAVTEKLTGRAVIAGVPEGSQPLSLRTPTLPAYYRTGTTASTLSVPPPGGSGPNLPLTLPIGSNQPFVYMAFGDSITDGDGSAQHPGGYRGLLQDALRAHFGGGATLVNEAQSGSRSDTGAERIGLSLNRTRPAYTLILYGTNDWGRIECRNAFPCFTIDALRSMVGAARAAGSLPILATVPAVHPVDAQEGRADWVARMNDLVRPMARQEGVPLADIHTAFIRRPDVASLFVDRVHPNDRGYEIIAAEFLAAITRPLGAASTSAPRLALFRPPAPPSSSPSAH